MQKQELEELIRNYQNKDNLWDVKKLNEPDECENIYVYRDTVFLGTNRLQIKKLDGTIEKYNIERYYPIDERDEKIKELNKKVEELERRLNDEPTKHNESDSRGNESITNDDVSS